SPCLGVAEAPGRVVPPQRSRRLPVHTAAAPIRPDSIAGSRRQRFVAGLYAKPTRAAERPAAPPTTRISCPSHTPFAPPPGAGSGAIRRHLPVAGLYAAA